MTDATFEVCVVGGCGRAGLPLAIAFARLGLKVAAYDIDAERAHSVSSGCMPFREEDGAETLREVLARGTLVATTDIHAVSRAEHVIIVVGTPVDEFLNPTMTSIRRCIDDIAPHLRADALLILRSTVYPGTTEWARRTLAERGRPVDVAFCPERIAEGRALEELPVLPQIIGSDTEGGRRRARALFERLVPLLVDTTSREAEVAKLLTNAWRYMKFAVANYFFMVCRSAGLDYGRILQAVRYEYPRAQDLPGPGFAAGPCLLKDTMQLAAFSQNNFLLGQTAMAVNEGLPAFVVDQMARTRQLRGKTVGILGMAFKAESDDPRASLSYKLRKLLLQHAARVLCTDPFVHSDELVSLERVLEESDVLVIGAPHRAYRELTLAERDVVDVWGITSADGSPRL